MPPEGPAKPLDRIARARALREAKVTESVVRMKFEGARKQVKLTGEDPLPGKTNYFIGNDPKKWQTDVPTYRRCASRARTRESTSSSTATAATSSTTSSSGRGSIPARCACGSTALGALEKADDGGLRIATAGGSLDLARPYLYQEIAGRKVEVAGSYLFDVPWHSRVLRRGLRPAARPHRSRFQVRDLPRRLSDRSGRGRCGGFSA